MKKIALALLGAALVMVPVSAQAQIVTSYLLRTNNGSDVLSPSTFRSNIGAAASGAIGSSGLTMSTSRLLGRTTASTGAVEEISVGTGLSLSGGVLSSTGGTGTVTSVGLALPSSILTVSGSPVTGSGTLTGTLATQAANTVWAGPSTGSAAAPAFRALVGADLPNPSGSSLGGVQSLAAVTHKWINTISTSGVPAATQPACGDLSDSAGGCSAVLGTGVGTFLATPSSANLAAALTDETGTGAALFATSPTGSGTWTLPATNHTGAVTVNLNAVGLVTPITGTILQVQQVDATASFIEMDGLGSVGGVSLRRANGTGASKSAITSSNVLGNIVFDGFDGTAYSSNAASIRGRACGNNWSTSDHSTQLLFLTTSGGTTTLNTALTLDCDQTAVFGALTQQSSVTTVSALGTCNAGARGVRKYVTDGSAASIWNGVTTAGGTLYLESICDGTNWRNL